MDNIFFNYSTLENIYQDREINIKITIKIKNEKKDYYIKTKVTNNFPNNIIKLVDLIPNIKNDINLLIKNNIDEKIEFKLLLNEDGSKMSLLSSININYVDIYLYFSKL